MGVIGMAVLKQLVALDAGAQLLHFVQQLAVEVEKLLSAPLVARMTMMRCICRICLPVCRRRWSKPAAAPPLRSHGLSQNWTLRQPGSENYVRAHAARGKRLVDDASVGTP
jgi:hypothetical protein